MKNFYLIFISLSVYCVGVNAASEAIYSGNTNTLHIPHVLYEGKKYSVTMEFQAPNKLILKTATPFQEISESPAVVVSNELNFKLTDIDVGGQPYKADVNFIKGSEFNATGIVLANNEDVNEDVKKVDFDVATVNQDGYVDIEFTKNDVSLLLNVAVKDKEKSIVITEIIDPTNHIIYSVKLGEDELENLKSAFVDSPYDNEGDVAAFLPPNSKLEMKVGIYRFKIVSEEPLSKVEAFIKSVKADENINQLQYSLNLNVWVAHPNIALEGQKNIISTNNFKQFFNNQYKKSINQILAPHSLALNKINFFFANKVEVEKFGDLDEKDSGDACRALKKVTNNNYSLNLGFMRTLLAEESKPAGFSPSPGNILDKTATNGCFFVAQTAYEADLSNGFTQDLANKMMAGNILHEAAHFLSLEHLTEADGTNFDHFNDTPKCDALTNDGRDNAEDFGIVVSGTKNGIISDYECGIAGGANNFLFYSGIPDYLPFIMSAEQATTFRLHPLTIRSK